MMSIIQKEETIDLGKEYFIDGIKVKKNLSFEEDRFFKIKIVRTSNRDFESKVHFDLVHLY